MTKPDLLIVGFPEVTHIGYHLMTAASDLGLATDIIDMNAAFSSSRVRRAYNWRFRAHRPPRLKSFSRLVLEKCRTLNPLTLLCTGFAPIQLSDLETIRKKGIKTLNFLTDDPFSLSTKAKWFVAALPGYDHVFTPRKANLEDLEDAGCRGVSYLPFAYNPSVHYPVETPSDPLELESLRSDVLFIGGADEERIPFFTALSRAGLRVALYGGYWERHSETRAAARGSADAETMRKAMACTKVVPCLVRRSNRDGHSMRSYEAPAMRGCVLAEGTEDHRSMFGMNGETAVFFDTPDELTEAAESLVADVSRRDRLAVAAWSRIVEGGNTYTDRLRAMLATEDAA